MTNAASRLTLVIPTFRRPDKARRALEFWANRGFRILMLDGSETPLDLPDAARSDPAITYMHMPEPLSARLGHAAASIDTEYTTLCGDDDFLLPSALRSCVDFLDRCPDYAACGGQALGFSRGLNGLPRAFVRYERFRDLDINGATPRDRALSYFALFTPATVYSVCRSGLWAQGMALWSVREFPIYAIGEIQFEFLMAYSGKIRRLPALHWLRSHEVAHGTHQRSGKLDVSLSKTLTPPQVWQNADHAALRAEVTDVTAATIAGAQGMPKAQVSVDFQDALDAYLRGLQKTRAGVGPAVWLRQKLEKRLNRWRLPFWLRVRMLRRQGITCDDADIAAVLAQLGVSR